LQDPSLVSYHPQKQEAGRQYLLPLQPAVLHSHAPEAQSALLVQSTPFPRKHAPPLQAQGGFKQGVVATLASQSCGSSVPGSSGVQL
jgi:hypothetical protein